MGETVFEFSHHHLSLSRSVCHIRRLSQQNEFQCRTVSVISPANSAIQCCMSVISPAHSRVEYSTVRYSVVCL